MLLKTRMQ